MPGGQSRAWSWAALCVYFVIANVGLKTELTFQDLSDGDVLKFQKWKKNVIIWNEESVVLDW